MLMFFRDILPTIDTIILKSRDRKIKYAREITTFNLKPNGYINRDNFSV